MQTRSIVVIGAGRMGKFHLKTIANSKQFRLAAIVEPASDKLSANHAGEAPVFKNLADLSQVEFDSAIVASPTETHHDIAEWLLKQGKDLLVEKPLTSEFNKATHLIKLAEENKRLLSVGHIERFNSATLQLKAALKHNALGEVLSFNAVRAGPVPEYIGKGNNVILDMAVHDLDFVANLAGKLSLIASHCSAPKPHDPFYQAEILLHTEHGAAASISASWLSPIKHRLLRVTGSRGVAILDFIKKKTVLFLYPESGKGDPELRLGFDFLEIEKIIPPEDALEAQLKEFYTAITNGSMSQNLCPAEEAAEAVKLAEDAKKYALDWWTRTNPSRFPS